MENHHFQSRSIFQLANVRLPECNQLQLSHRDWFEKTHLSILQCFTGHLTNPQLMRGKMEFSSSNTESFARVSQNEKTHRDYIYIYNKDKRWIKLLKKWVRRCWRYAKMLGNTYELWSTSTIHWNSGRWMLTWTVLQRYMFSDFDNAIVH